MITESPITMESPSLVATTNTATCAREVLVAMSGVLDQLGFDGQTILVDAGINADFLANPAGRIPLAVAYDAWLLAHEVARRRDFGLLVGQAISVTTFGPLGYALCACQTLFDALEMLSQYAFIIDDGLRLSLTRTSTAIHVDLSIPETRTDDAKLAYIVVVYRFCRIVSERCRLLGVQLPMAHATIASECRTTFDVTPKFTERVAFVFDATMANQALVHFDPTVLCQAKATLDDYVFQNRGQTFAQRITRTLQDRLKNRTYSLAEIARSFNTSQRSLQRQLHREKVTFRELLSETRHRMALELLTQPEHSITQVGSLLGFADVSSFSHAFRRWTDESPEAYKRRSRD
ncbi:MAG: AraC family transcriptional regulator ligand-binding domain-containing protein [Gammaproteobacteria bacterium]|nr:AraC family transcriptional regulator ligand-binding domain-containing protein [Gammaproteobacteria bacterium]